MSDVPPDLSRLALDRTPARTGAGPRNRRWMTRFVLPAGILLGFVALLCAAAGRQLMTPPSVTVMPVIAKRGDVQRGGTPLFQAAGWIEPRPTSVSVAALVPGVIEHLLVVEGQQVEAGEPVARLISIDAQLAVKQAAATLMIREGEVQRAYAEKTAAVARFDNPVHLKAELADAKSVLAAAVTEREKLPFLIKAAEAAVAFTESSYEGKRAAKEAIATVVVERAEMDYAAASTLFASASSAFR